MGIDSLSLQLVVYIYIFCISNGFVSIMGMLENIY